MRWKLLDDASTKTYVLIFETGDEVATELKKFAVEQSIDGASFKGIGALSSVKMDWFDWQTKKYETAATFDEQVEVLSLIGDVAMDRGKPAVHAHIVVGRRDGTAHGGHLMEARVRPTLELVLTETPTRLRKKVDAESGLALIELG